MLNMAKLAATDNFCYFLVFRSLLSQELRRKKKTDALSWKDKNMIDKQEVAPKLVPVNFLNKRFILNLSSHMKQA